MVNMFEISKEFTHSSDPFTVYVVVGESVDAFPILQRKDGSNGPFVEKSPDRYQAYIPPPPNVKRYVNIYSRGAIGCDYDSLELCVKGAGPSPTDRLEMELTHDGKFVKARSVM